MKKLIILLVLNLGSLSSQELPFLDSLVVTDTNTVWTQNEGYQSSDFKISGVDYFKKIDTTYFIKNNNIGYLLSSKDGSGYKIIYQPESDGFKPATWDIPYDNLNKIYSFDFENRGIGVFNITSKSNNRIDSLKTFTIKERGGISDYGSGKNVKMLALNNGNVIVYADYSFSTGPYLLHRYYSYMYNEFDNTLRLFSPLVLLNSEISISEKYLMSFNKNILDEGTHKQNYSDSYDIFDLSKKDSLTKKATFIVPDMEDRYSSHFIVNDSISIFIKNDSLVINNFNTTKIIKTFNVSGRKSFSSYYYIQESKTLIYNSIGISDGLTYLTAIHLPSLNIIKDTINNKPYLSRILTKLASGEFLSVGFDNYIYKFNSDFGFDYAISDFNNELIGNKMIQFTDQSNGPIIKWSWDFDDGNTSEERNPQHQYTNTGTYTVILIVENEFGTLDTSSHEVIAEDKLTSFFSADLLAGEIPLTVEFKNRSLGKPTRFIWNFGDGTSSKEENPTHTYTMSGTYGVSLTIFDDNEEFDMVLLEKLISVSE